MQKMLAKITPSFFLLFFFLFSAPIVSAYCFPQRVSLSSAVCSGGQTSSVDINWDGSNCTFCLYVIYNNGIAVQHFNSSPEANGCDNNPANYHNLHTTVSNPSNGSIGVGPDWDANRDNISNVGFTNSCTPPTPTPTPIPPTSTPVPPTPTNTVTPIPPTPTATPVPRDSAIVTVKLSSIDTQDASISRLPRHGSATNPRKLTLYFYKDTNNIWQTDLGVNPDIKVRDNVFFVSKPADSYGTYVATAFHTGIIPEGNYFVLAKTEGSLWELLTQDNTPIHIPPSDNAPITFDFTTGGRTLPMGDLNDDNQITAQDWSNFQTCYDYPNDPAKKSDCENPGLGMFDDSFKSIPISDLNDDGVVDGIDFNNFLITFKQHEGL